MVHAAIEIAESEYQAVRDFIVRKTGLFFQENKREDLLTVLQDRLGVLHRFSDLGAYLAFLEREEDGGRELRGLVSRLTVGETYFFRNRGQFTALRDQILPEIIRRRRGKHQCLRIWSAGCSTGEEPYSLAILLRELLADIGDWNIHILATDINEDALAAAREGVYRNWSFREVEEHYRQQYFTPEGESSRIRPEVQSMVTLPLPQPRRRPLPDGGDRHGRAGPDPLPQRDDLFPPGALPGGHPPLLRLSRGAGLAAGGPLGAQRPGLLRVFAQLHRPDDRLPEERPEPGLGKGHRHPLPGQRLAAAGDR